jgi:hypothetical protein
MKLQKNLCRLAFLISITSMGWAQQIPFPKKQHADSLTVAKYIPLLAQKTIAVYKEPNGIVYKDNLFRLQVTAGNYAAVAPLLREFTQEAYGDSTQVRLMGIAFRWYANVMIAKPKTKEEFESLFKKQFQQHYPADDLEGQNMVEEYYNKDLKGLKQDFDTKLNAIAHKESLSVGEAVGLCRSYCSYLTFSRTLSLAKALLKETSDRKYITEDNIILTMKDGGTVSLTVVRLKSVTTPQPVVLIIFMPGTTSPVVKMPPIGVMLVLLPTPGAKG